MRSPLRKELIACFKREFQPRFPQFTLAKGLTWTWTWKIAPHLILFVKLQAFEKKDQFIVEVAWSESGEFPWGGIGKGIDPNQSKGRARLGRLWEKGRDEPVWDVAPEKTAGMKEVLDALARGESPNFPPDPPLEEVLPRVCPLVRDAVSKFEQYGIPLFRRVAESRGIEWPADVTPDRPSPTA